MFLIKLTIYRQNNYWINYYSRSFSGHLEAISSYYLNDEQVVVEYFGCVKWPNVAYILLAFRYIFEVFV